MSQPRQKKQKHKTLVWWVILVGFVLSFMLMLVPKPELQVNVDVFPWKSHFNEQNKLVALGVVINENTANDAIKIFGEDYEILAFSKKDESQKVVEIYFPTMMLSRVRGVATLVMDVPEKLLKEAYARGVKTTVNTSGNRQVTLLAADANLMLDYKIKYITYVPKVSLTEEMIRSRFGEPAKIKPDEGDVTRWLYPNKGLEIIVNPNGAEVLQFNPAIRP